MARAVVSLHYLGKESTANELAEEISRRFDTIARVNNTRREVIRNGRLLEFVGSDESWSGLPSTARRILMPI